MQFYGDVRTHEELEFAGLKIDPQHRIGEPELGQKRWFDVRGLHPTLATYYYTRCFTEAVQQFHATCIDERTASTTKGLMREDIFECDPREATSMWLARRAADEVGCPYPFVMRFAQARALTRHFFRFPRPNQLHGEEFQDDLLTEWTVTKARAIQYSREPNLSADATPQQKLRLVWAQHQRFVLDQVATRPAPHHNLLGRLLKERVLDEAVVKERFGVGVFDRAVDMAASLAAVSHR
jgi:hypothetical protein